MHIFGTSFTCEMMNFVQTITAINAERIVFKNRNKYGKQMIWIKLHKNFIFDVTVFLRDTQSPMSFHKM